MMVKKFRAETETEAIIKVKEELGSKAIILNVKTLKQRGLFRLFRKDMVEVTAALEEEEFMEGAEKLSFNNVVTNEAYNKNISDINAAAGTGNSRLNLVANENISIKPETAVIEQKLDSLHNLLQNRIYSENAYKAEAEADMGVQSESDSGQKILEERENSNIKSLKLVYKHLLDNEVEQEYADEIIGDIGNSLKRESNIDSILSAVYQKIILKLGEPKCIKLGDKPKIVLFIGPTGVGKTTTIAKIASHFKLEESANVAFITADTYRIAAIEQLNTYANIIDSPVSVVYSADELESSIKQYKDYDLILVDTAGRSHKCEEQMTELTELLDKAREFENDFDIEIYLTLSITTKYKDLVNITERYNDIKGWSVIFTKLDETCSLGNILNIRMLTGATLSYTTSGQNVPNDIEVINEQALAKRLLGGND